MLDQFSFFPRRMAVTFRRIASFFLTLFDFLVCTTLYFDILYLIEILYIVTWLIIQLQYWCTLDASVLLI